MSRKIVATTLAVPSGRSQALDGEPAAGSLKRRVKALDAGMAFPGNGQPFEGTRADAVPDQNVLLAWMCCGAAQRHVADLAGLRATPIQQRGTDENMVRQVTEPCHNASVQPCVRPTFF